MRKSKSHITQRQDAVKYGRVSSKEQEKEGFSIPAQFKLLDQYAKSQGLKVVSEFVDVETAKKPGRAGFDEMVKFLKRSSVRVLLVEKTDRPVSQPQRLRNRGRIGSGNPLCERECHCFAGFQIIRKVHARDQSSNGEELH
jgi:hypothetical protein